MGSFPFLSLLEAIHFSVLTDVKVSLTSAVLWFKIRLFCFDSLSFLDQWLVSANCHPVFCFPLSFRPLTKNYQEVLRSVFLSSTSYSGASRKRTIKDLQEEVSNLYNNIRLFEKGAKHFTGEIKSFHKNIINKHFVVRAENY